VILIALNTALALQLGLDFSLGHLQMTALDVIGLMIAGAMIALLLGRVIRNLRQLAGREPAASRRG
jgi:NhaP-type Na+/H+ or K+/H+ antiporter